LDRWLEEIMGIKGIPIPYGAPNASPYAEWFIRTPREEALNHFIFLGVDHIHRVTAEYIRYCNGTRPSQAIHGTPDPYSDLRQPPSPTGKLVASPFSVGFSTTIDSRRNLPLGHAPEMMADLCPVAGFAVPGFRTGSQDNPKQVRSLSRRCVTGCPRRREVGFLLRNGVFAEYGANR
jgi:hypothetical protein